MADPVKPGGKIQLPPKVSGSARLAELRNQVAEAGSAIREGKKRIEALQASVDEYKGIESRIGGAKDMLFRLLKERFEGGKLVYALRYEEMITAEAEAIEAAGKKPEGKP